MTSDYKPVPISVAEQIATDYDKHQVIVVTWDDEHKLTHVTTYGRSVEECAQAAVGGNMVKAALGWPESLCDAIPDRLQARLEAEYQKGYDDGVQDWTEAKERYET